MSTITTDAKIVSNERSKFFYVYAGQIEPGFHGYFQITTIETNNGESIQGMNIRRYNKALFKCKTIGAIFPVETAGNDVFYRIKETPVEYWKNKSDVAAWQLTHRSSELLAKKIKDASENQYYEILEPIRNAYHLASHQNKSLIIAEVIRSITRI